MGNTVSLLKENKDTVFVLSFFGFLHSFLNYLRIQRIPKNEYLWYKLFRHLSRFLITWRFIYFIDNKLIYKNTKNNKLSKIIIFSKGLFLYLIWTFINIIPKKHDTIPELTSAKHWLG